MSVNAEISRRALLVGDDSLHAPLMLSGWEVVLVSNTDQASFYLEGQPCDVLIHVGTPGDGLSGLASYCKAPLIAVSDLDLSNVLDSIRLGANWLPLSAVRKHPMLLLAAMDRALQVGKEREQLDSLRIQLRETRARVDQLLGMLWEVTPIREQAPWFSQRHMFQRLDEEVARVNRLGGPLSVLLGDLRPAPGEPLVPDQANQVARWAANLVRKSKRRCDVAGQYGLTGFMVLLPGAGPEQARGAASRLRRILADPPHNGGPAIHARFGFASAPSDLATMHGLLSRADERLETDEPTPVQG